MKHDIYGVIKGIIRPMAPALRAMALVVLFFLISCSGPLQQANLNIREPFHSPEFKSVKAQEAIGLLTATNNDNGLEYRKLLGDFVEESMKRQRPGVRIVPYWQTLNVINREGLTSEYAVMLKDYSTTGILEKKTLGKLGASIGVKYFVQPRIIDFSQRSSIRFQPFGFTMFVTHESQIKIYIEMWDAASGEIVWIGVAEGNMATEHFMARPIPFEQAAKTVIDELIKKMPLGGE
ncbi:MAG: DUF4136 domain-containing protein [Deltaproteobacteria bacterium]